MKKNITALLYLSVLSLIVLGCDRAYDPVFEETADERVRQKIEEYRSVLLGAPNGWKAILYTGTGPGFLFFFDFKENGVVTLISDFDANTGGEVQQSTYSMKGLQRPTLSFDTYSYLHLLADPSGSVNGGVDGVGLISDFEFSVEGVEGDSVVLIGLQNSTRMVLIKASAAEESQFLAGVIGDRVTNTQEYLEANPYPFIPAGSGDLAVLLDLPRKMVNLLVLDQNDNVIQLGSPFTFSTTGMLLRDPVQFGNLSFQEIFWDNTLQNFFVQSGNQKIYFESAASPVIPLIHALGFLHQFVFVDPSVAGYEAKLPSAFLDIYNQAKTGVFNVDDYQLELIAFSLQFNQTSTVYMDYYVRNSTGTYRARYTYNMSVNGAGQVTFGFVNQDPNGQVISPGLAPLLNYFKDNTFSVEYYQDGDFGVMAGFYPEEIPAAFFYGFLE